jgi:hypothetical protein
VVFFIVAGEDAGDLNWSRGPVLSATGESTGRVVHGQQPRLCALHQLEAACLVPRLVNFDPTTVTEIRISLLVDDGAPSSER